MAIKFKGKLFYAGSNCLVVSIPKSERLVEPKLKKGNYVQIEINEIYEQNSEESLEIHADKVMEKVLPDIKLKETEDKLKQKFDKMFKLNTLGGNKQKIKEQNEN